MKILTLLEKGTEKKVYKGKIVDIIIQINIGGLKQLHAEYPDSSVDKKNLFLVGLLTE